MMAPGGDAAIAEVCPARSRGGCIVTPKSRSRGQLEPMRRMAQGEWVVSSG
jgi:hypothetical protein